MRIASVEEFASTYVRVELGSDRVVPDVHSGEKAMMAYRIFPLVALLAVVPIAAIAQFDGMPGFPGAVPWDFGNPAGGPLPACLQLVALRDETQKHWETIEGQDSAMHQYWKRAGCLGTSLQRRRSSRKGLRPTAAHVAGRPT